MTAMIMGGETEYAVSARDEDGAVVPQDKLLRDLTEHAFKTLGYSSASGRGRFLSNGGLLYLDAGLHLEWATPECTSPYDVVRYLQAGDRIVLDLARSFRDHGGVAEIFCSRTNVDYVSDTLWAAHESHQHTVNPEEVPAQLMPFLASRVIFGAGGWDYRSPGLRFTTSPRAHFITELIDVDSQHTRPLFNSRDEPLGKDGTHRLHIVCAESLCSEKANVLRFGTAALVMRLLEHGIRPAEPVMLASPVAALHHFATRPGFGACARRTAAGRLTAVQIQRHYLQEVTTHFNALALPSWAEGVCELWKTTLDHVERMDAALDTTLDWAIKRRLFEQQICRHGLTWAMLRSWDKVLYQLRRRWALLRTDIPFDIGVAHQHAGLESEWRGLDAHLRRHGLAWDDLPRLAVARKQVFELDAKFGALDPDGIFNALDAAGVLTHRVGPLDTANAVATPPQDTRARIRGDVVKRLSGAGTRYGAEWTGIVDFHAGRQLDLTNAFETAERWTEIQKN